MLNVTRKSGKVILLGIITATALVSCMKDHSDGGGGYITRPYQEDGYYCDGKLFYSMDHTTACVVGSDGGTSSIVIPDAIQINEITYPVGSIKNLGIYQSPGESGQFGPTVNNGLSSIQLGPNIASIQSDTKDDVFYERVVLTPRGEEVYLPSLAISAPLKRRYPIKDVVVRYGNPIYDSRENSNCLIHYASGRVVFGGVDAKVPPAISEIAPCAFVGCESLKKDCTLPNGLVSIDYSAFQNCALIRVVLPQSLEAIGAGAFWGNHLREITIPAKVSEIGDNAFADNDLSAISVDEANEMFDSRNNCNAVIQTDSNALVIGCDNTVIPNEIRSINSCAFYDCTHLKITSLPDSLESIGDHAFMDCINIDTLVVPERTKNIGKAAFYGCKKLTYVVLPEDVTVGEGAFRNCEGLTRGTVKVTFHDPDAVDPAVFGFSNPEEKAYRLLVPDEAETLFLESKWRNYFLSIVTYK